MHETMNNSNIAAQIYAKICFETTPGQKKIVEMLSEYLADPDFTKIFVLNGYAGTGKTTLIAATVAALKGLGMRTVLLAPTGRAAKVLARYSGEKALTIHKRIYRERTTADYESKFSLDLNREQGALFIVDEASMLSDESGGGFRFGSGSLPSHIACADTARKRHSKRLKRADFLVSRQRQVLFIIMLLARINQQPQHLPYHAKLHTAEPQSEIKSGTEQQRRHQIGPKKIIDMSDNIHRRIKDF